MSKQNFSNFTNLYSIQKTLRFELKPVGETQQMLIANNVFKKDENRKKSYEEIKPFIDRLHREFISESLQNVNLEGINEYYEVLQNYKTDKKNKVIVKIIDAKRKRLREQIVEVFNQTGKYWAEHKFSNLKIKKKDLNILFEEEVFQILKFKYGSEKETNILNEDTGENFSIFDNWKGFTGYFTKFFETRKNFYKGDGTSSAIATRAIDQNLDRFLENLSTFSSVKIKLDLKEVENSFSLKASDVFNLKYYSSCLLQEGIDKYNEFIGGKTLDNGEKKKGINELINEYKQQHPENKISFLKKLDKQILSEKVRFIEEIESDEVLINVLTTFLNESDIKIGVIKTLLSKFFKNTDDFDINGIFISKEAFNTISHKWTNETDTFSSQLYEVLKSQKVISSSAKKKDGTYSFPDFVSLGSIKLSLESLSFESKFWKEWYFEEKIIQNEMNLWDQFIKIFSYEFESHFASNLLTGKEDYHFYKTELSKLLKDFKLNKESKGIVKEYADAVLHIYQIAKYFAIEKKRSWNTEYDSLLDSFYTEPEIGYLKFYDNAYEEIVQPYNRIRNYLTKKPYREDKWKLNFENPTLAKGWDKNKERDNSAIILRKGENYYLAVMKKGHNNAFLAKNTPAYNGSQVYEKLVYKLFPDPSKMMPKVCFSKKGIDFFKPSNEIHSIYKNSEFKKGETFSVKSMQKLIEFYINALSSYPGWKYYSFTKVKSANAYTNNIGEFFNDVAETGYKIWFENISEDYINSKNANGELYLFQIYNQDFSAGSTGTKNLHTLYFQELFSNNNVKNNYPFKLNGEAELFFRPRSLDSEIAERNFKRKIINKKRYTEDKLFFHVPITLNRNSKGTYRYNALVNDFLANNPEINIIGVDRGEKHLAYYSVINQKGELLDSGSLNSVKGGSNKLINYQEKLEEKAKKREQERRDWQEVEGIKDLKKGYISQVVRKLADLAIENNAIIVMEDLNMRFKQIRGGIEKSIYQQLEKALIEKLNFLVSKGESDPLKAGHLLKAYQLTAPFESFQSMGKQTGIIFYTQASYTSKIDPLTGWRPNLYIKYSSAEKAKVDILKFKDIKYTNNRFEFTYDIKDFANSKSFPKKTEWTICSSVERFRWDRKLNNNKGGYIHYKDITEYLDKLLNEFDILKNSDIKAQIKNIDASKKENAKLFRDFIYYIGLISQIRNTHLDKEGDENDFILSPIEPFFDSRKSNKFGPNLPQNGDDNGAYNIARKGIIILNKITDFVDTNKTSDNMKWDNIFVSQTEWDDYAQSY